MTDNNEKRIRLAEAMGWMWDESIRPRKNTPDKWCCWIKPDGDKWFDSDAMPDPYTDANDDYAVLEWARTQDRHFLYKYGDAHFAIRLSHAPTANGVPCYQIGDYANAALQVIDNSTPDEEG